MDNKEQVQQESFMEMVDRFKALDDDSKYEFLLYLHGRFFNSVTSQEAYEEMERDADELFDRTLTEQDQLLLKHAVKFSYEEGYKAGIKRALQSKETTLAELLEKHPVSTL